MVGLERTVAVAEVGWWRRMNARGFQKRNMRSGGGGFGGWRRRAGVARMTHADHGAGIGGEGAGRDTNVEIRKNDPESRDAGRARCGPDAVSHETPMSGFSSCFVLDAPGRSSGMPATRRAKNVDPRCARV